MECQSSFETIKVGSKRRSVYGRVVPLSQLFRFHVLQKSTVIFHMKAGTIVCNLSTDLCLFRICSETEIHRASRARQKDSKEKYLQPRSEIAVN